MENCQNQSQNQSQSQSQNSLDVQLNLIRMKKAFEPSEFVNKRTNEFLEYLETYNLHTVVLSVSGGIDSALSAVLFSRVLGSENVYLINMPSKFNSSLTKNAAFKLAENLNCPFASIGITNSIDHTKSQLNEISFLRSSSVLDISTLVFENIQARDRGGRILSALSASLKGVFSCNANKSELTVGYSTLYGDQAGFLSPIADLWKKDVYELSKFYNKSKI